MTKNIYTVRDNKAGAYLEPFYSQNDDTAFRSIANCLRDPEHTFSINIEDYDLYYLGSYEDTTGCISAETNIVHLTSFVNFKNTLKG